MVRVMVRSRLSALAEHWLAKVGISFNVRQRLQLEPKHQAYAQISGILLPVLIQVDHAHWQMRQPKPPDA